MNRHKQSATLMLSILPLLSAFADDAKMTATAIDGRKYEIKLTENMQGSIHGTWSDLDEPYSIYVYSGAVNFDENGIPVADESPEWGEPGKIWLIMPVTEVKKISFSGTSAIDEVNDNEISISISESRVSISSVTEPVMMRIFSTDGRKEAEMTLTQDSTVDISRHGSGVHVITIGNATFKMLVK